MNFKRILLLFILPLLIECREEPIDGKWQKDGTNAFPSRLAKKAVHFYPFPFPLGYQFANRELLIFIDTLARILPKTIQFTFRYNF